jgi:dTMP kinase
MSLFVTFEGPEGAGKSTQARRLAAWLRAAGYVVTELREPGGTAIGERIRAILLDDAHHEMAAMTEVLLFAAARAQLVRQVIRPRLAAGDIVICDRYADSTLAHQGYGLGGDLDELRRITYSATGGLEPDVTVLLEMPVAAALERKQRQLGDAWNRLDARAIGYHERVAAGYRAVCAAAPARWHTIDATADVDDVARRIEAAIRPSLDRVAGVRRSSEREPS